MQELVFQVEFKSDIVLPASSNTEGNISQLDFIPGSNFLGMVAKNYTEFSNSFDVFHSGKVRFGDATLLVDEQEAYKVPFSFFHPKLKEERIFHHHFLSVEKRKELGQLKQMRGGYILADMSKGLKVEHLNYNYAQKSAYDSKNRRSKTSAMYGYRAIEAGTQWQFVVKYDKSMSSDDITLLKSILLDSKRLGKSKSSQYGQIEIIEAGKSINLSNDIKENEELILYAKSRIALVDSEGNATYDLQYLFDGAKVVYDKCQIRTSSFTPYNGAMQTKTYERLVIEKGSVIVLKGISTEQKEQLQNGVGLYLSEGFGELLLNPSFLMQSEEIATFEKKKNNDNKDQRKKIEMNSKYDTVNFLIKRHNREISKLTLTDEVQEFMDKKKALYKKIKNAQWGTIRSICTAGEENFKDEIRAYISSGKVEWDKDQISNLLDDKHDLVFIKLLAMQMPKINGGAK